MISSSTEFWYNGHSSKEFGITNCHVDNTNSNNMYSEPFLGSRTINEEKLKWNPKPYFYNSQEACKTFALSFGFDKNIMIMNKTSLRRLAMWFSDTRQYHEIWFAEDCNLNANGDYDITSPRRVYRMMITGDSTINHFGLNEGYISLSLRTDSPYCYSPILGGRVWSEDERANDGDGSYIYYGNYADMVIKPQIQIIVGQKNPDDITDDPHNQSIKIIGQKIEDNQLPPITYDGFQRDYPYTPTDYTKFPIFEFSGGVKASGFFQLLGTVFYGEKFYLGNKTYEFDLGMGKPYKKNEINNILVPINDGIKAYNTLRFNEDSNVTDGSTVTIGDQNFEYDWNDIVASTDIKVDISNYVANAKGILHLNSNLMPNQQFSIGDITYTMIGGTNEFIVKITNHMLTDGTEANYIVRNDVKTLTQSNTNISTRTAQDISQCLLRNVTRNTSDLGIRKMKYLDKDFVMCLWNGESDEDYQQEIDDVPINGRLTISFDEPVNQDTVNNNTIQVRDIEGNQINVTFDISTNDGGKVIGVTPSSNYSYDTDYYLYVSRGVKDIKGNSYKQIRKIKFHTKTQNTSTTETYNNVSIVKVFNFYNSKKIDSSTLTDSNIYVVKNGDSTHIDVNIKLINSGHTISVYPKTKYSNSQTYNLHITTGIKDTTGTAILATEKVITFTTESVLNETVIDDDFIPITDFEIDKSIKIPFDDKLNESYVNSSVIKMFDANKTEIPVYLEISSQYPNILVVTPVNLLNYNSIYYLYITGALQYTSGVNISSPKQYKILTMTEDEARNINTTTNNNELTVTETGDVNLQHIDLETPVNTDKVITKDFGVNLDETTINTTNIYVKDSEGNLANITVEKTLDNSGIRIFPNLSWESNESYNVFITNGLKSTDKPRVFAGDTPAQGDNLGDYANAVNIFGTGLGLTIVKTNGFKVQGTNLLDLNGDIVKFTKYDIVFQNNSGLTANDFNSDGTVKDGTSITCIPTKGIYTASAKNLAGKDRIDTKNQMKNYADFIKGQSWLSSQLYLEDTNIITFSTKSSNEHISIDIDNTIVLNNEALLVNEVPKKIVGQIANDNIDLYNEHNKDFCVDRNMLVPYIVPQGAKVYAGKSVDTTNTIPDDFTNATSILGTKGYTIVDTTSMTLTQKQAIVFKEGDLIIGGELAGAKASDFDALGNILTSRPGTAPTDDPNDKRVERISGIPYSVNIYPGRRLQGSGNKTGREGTKQAMLDWVKLLDQAAAGTLPDGYSQGGGNIALNGITVKYKVPDGAKVYGTGADYYNSLVLLSDFGYEFINVGTMTYEEKQNLPFKEGDTIVGGTQATDIVTGEDVNGNPIKTTVQGIPAIDIKGATRLGGKDRYETEKLISQYAANLRVKSIDAGDIIKLTITIDDPNNNLSTNGTIQSEYIDSTTNSTTINNNIRVEYHQVKSIKNLERNRVFIEFEEDIRTIKYIKDIEITNLYKLYDQRLAEDYVFTAPYQIKDGYDKKETMINIVKCINLTGEYGIEYSTRTFKHPIVLAQIANDNEIELDAIEPGTQGNIAVSLIDRFDPLNRFLTPTLTGGQDCIQSNAVKALAETILTQNDLPERYNKDQYTVSYDSTTLTVTHKMYGEKYNNIICLANVTQQYQTPYIITNNGTGVSNASLINLKDYLTREKQIAKWDNGATLIGGTNPSITKIIEALKNKIDATALDSNNKKMFNLTYILGDDGVTRVGINIEYYIYGEIGNVVLNTTCVNGKISGKKLSGGIDGLYVGEIITMDCDKKFITSSLGKDRKLNFNGNWLEIPLDGVKLVTKKGVFTIEYRYKELYYI